jgi:ABC-type uncharacterized transport system involved in gliding motility auxiliary subunit
MNRVLFNRIFTSAAGLLVVGAILAAVHVIVQPFAVRKDLTQEKLFTLSKGTVTLLGELDRDVTLKLYFSKSMEGVPIPLKQYAQRITDLLHEYTRHSGRRVVVEAYDPKPDSDEEEWAQRYGVTGQSLGMMGAGPQLYLGLVAVCGSREAVIPFLAPQAEPQIEYLITRLIHGVTISRRPKIAVLSALPMMGDEPNPYAMREGKAPWVFISELKKQYAITSLGAAASEIPPDVDTMMVVHPKELTDDTLFAIDQFVMRGGRLIAFVDPFCATEQELSTSSDPNGMGGGSDLDRLTKAWGAELVKGDMVVDLDAATQVSRGAGGVENSPIWLSLRGNNIDRDEVLTSSLKVLMLPLAGAFKLTPVDGVTATPLVWSSPSAGLVNAYQALGDTANLMRGFRKDGRQPIAVRLQGDFVSAFPGGKPKNAGATNEPPAAPALAKTEKPGVVLLVADVDLLYDRFSVREMNFFGQKLYEPVNDNLSFVVNMVEQMSGSEALIGVRSRGTYDRPFTRVLALQRTAQERWQAEELRLQTKLEEAQARLNQLQSAKQSDQQFILSPEQKQEIEAFRKQQFQTQQELKEVRKNLRRDIENLGMRVKTANIALVPGLVAAFGLVHGWRRRKRAMAGQ